MDLARKEEAAIPTVDQSVPLVFVGLADGSALENPATPLESWSLFKLARIKMHFAFPAMMRQASWCFLLKTDGFDTGLQLRVRLLNAAGEEQGHVNFGTTVVGEAPLTEGAPISPAEDPAKIMFALDRGQWVVQCIAIRDLVISEPGEYRLVTHWNGVDAYLGRVIFGYAALPPLTDEQISAYEADPVSHKSVRLVLGCKKCDAKLKAYAAIKQSDEQDGDGFTFYRNLPDRFRCACGASNLPLQYLREGMHGFLSRDAAITIGNVSYVQRYAHAQLLDIASKFLGLIQREKNEEPVQQFLAQNKVLFARFHAKQLFIKPRILGKFNADFAILDSEGALTLIEIERPSMRLFKKNGHARNDFNHAYEQVQDWLNEVLKHRAAVIEGLGLKPDDVLSIRGCVIAGRSKLENREHLRRHMSQPRQSIEFCTFDMLGQSLAEIARDLP